MNNDGGRLNYGVGLDNSQLRADASESRRLLQGIGQTAETEGDRIDEAFKKIGAAAAGVFAVSQIKNFVTQVATVRGEFQQLEIAFKTMLGSAAQADALMSQLVKTAATTPFGLTDIAQSAKQLLAYGVEADKVNETLIRLGDIAAGLSIPINDLAYLYGTTMVQGRLYTQDLNQFLGRGIPLIEQLAQQFGVAENQVKALVEEGKVGFPEVEQAIINLTNEGSMFGGLMAAQSQSITGQISNIEDAIDTMFNEIGKQNEGVINDALGLVSTLIENWETVGKVLLTVIATYGAYKAAVIAVAAAHKLMNIWGTVQAVLSLSRSIRSAKDAMLLFNMAVKANPLGLVLSVVAAAVSAFALFRDTTDEAADAIKAEREEAEEFNKRVGESAGKAISTYKTLQAEYKNCKTAHEQRQWIKESQTKFKELGIAVTSVNDAENIFVKNTSVMMTAFKKRAEAAAWQSKVDEEYAKRIERQMQLEDQRDKIQAGSKVPGYSHTTQGGNEYVDRSGNWVYTEQGAKNAREAFNRSIANDPVLNAIDERINRYTKKMSEVSSEFQGLFEQAGTTTKTKAEERDEERAAKEQQKIANETAQRNEKIREYSDKVSEAVTQAEFDIRQAQINAMDDGYEKTVAQVQLNYDRLIAENDKRAQKMIEDLKDKKTLEWLNQNPKATKEQEIEYRASLNLTTADLSSEQQAMLRSYAEIARQIQVNGNRAALDDMLKDVLTYEQQRTEIAEEYEKKRKALYQTDEQGNYVLDESGSPVLRQGVTQGNVDELNRQEEEALQRVDEMFAEREATYQAWCNQIADYTLEQLENVLAEAEAALEDAKKQGVGGNKLAEANAKVTTAKKKVSEARAKEDVSPDKRSIKEWEDLYKTLLECEKQFESIGNTVGGVAGEIISVAGNITTSSLSMINGIVQLVNMSSAGIVGTSTAAATAIQTVEKASVILTIISAAMQIVMQIVNLFNSDDEKQEHIEALQGRIDQLQWELDNADIVRLQENSGKAVERVRQALSETYQELLKNKLAVGDVAGAWRLLFTNVSSNSEVLEKTAEKLAKAYANIEYTADKALGGEKYASAKEQLENIAQQQILIQEQIEAEQSKKKSDGGQIEEWQRQIEELGQEAVQIINDMVEDIIGGSSSEIASELGDAFFEAFQAGEDYAEAWGDKVNEIVADVMKRMLVSKFLEEPLGEIFDKYKKIWFPNGSGENTLDSVINSMGSFAADLNAVGDDFATIWENLPDSVKSMFDVTEEATREASEKGIATASQESVDELNGRATAIQGHTYSISENTKIILSVVNMILQSVLNIETHTERISGLVEDVESSVKEMKDTVNDIALKGVKLK
ncbi:tape measure protein [Alistipes putredinis]|uniref:tape measure protein n=1 Tax=Alistipes putredinis TaxID=28117 RepID=UPI003079F6C1